MRAVLPIALLLMTTPAWATDVVSSPNVEQGRYTLEYRGGYDIDDDDADDGAQGHKLVVNYGITDRLRPEIKAAFAKEPGERTELDSMEFGLRYQILEADESWASAALDGNYTLATLGDEADTFHARILLAKSFGAFSNTANIGSEVELGPDAEGGAAFTFGWKTLYEVTPNFAPGFEYYANTGPLTDDHDFDDQSHKIGPTITGRIGDDFKYDVGYLFGLSDGAADGRAKLILSYTGNF